MTQKEYGELTPYERAEWIKSEVVAAVAAGKDILTPIMAGLFVEGVRLHMKSEEFEEWADMNMIAEGKKSGGPSWGLRVSSVLFFLALMAAAIAVLLKM